MRLFVGGTLVLMALIVAINAQADRSLPVDQGVITSTRGWRKDPFGSGKLMFHRGYDISVPMNTPVFPTQRGTVYFSGVYKGYGNLVCIDHGNSYVTMYGHNNRLLVKPGQKVDTKTVIALAGSTGRSTGPHVHYEVRQWPGGNLHLLKLCSQPRLVVQQGLMSIMRSGSGREENLHLLKLCSQPMEWEWLNRTSKSMNRFQENKSGWTSK